MKGRGKKNTGHFGFMEFFIEVKGRESDDVFQDPAAEADRSKHEFIPNRKDRRTRQTLGQITSYAAELCARQHRSHCFSISICAYYARLIRWDRAGAIVSERFNFVRNPEWLCSFFWRYSRASDLQRGFDLTIVKASKEEEDTFKRVVEAHVKEQRQLKDGDAQLLKAAVNVHYEPGRVFKIPIEPQIPKRYLDEPKRQESPDESPQPRDKLASISITEPSAQTDDPSPSSENSLPKCRWTRTKQFFLVSRPVQSPSSVASRATRAYWAVKLPSLDSGAEEAQIAFLKDTWRGDSDGDKMEKEGEVFMELIAAGVPNVSDIFCQGDVLDRDEETQGQMETKGPTAGASKENEDNCAFYVGFFIDSVSSF